VRLEERVDRLLVFISLLTRSQKHLYEHSTVHVRTVSIYNSRKRPHREGAVVSESYLHNCSPSVSRNSNLTEDPRWKIHGRALSV
jgi:hypothetical protein